mmetsp:Transcript_6408/g.14018  ORF Transcript_6408/g.14018 Transcript_6408/m.14018 type:complete len:475 (+) Transcript_6408:125-1549(+)
MAAKVKKTRKDSSSDSPTVERQRWKKPLKGKLGIKPSKKKKRKELAKSKVKRKQKGKAKTRTASSSTSSAGASQESSSSEDSEVKRGGSTASSSPSPPAVQKASKKGAARKAPKAGQAGKKFKAAKDVAVPLKPKKRTKAERITMLLEDRLSATARHIDSLQRNLTQERAVAEAAQARAAKALTSLESTRAKLRQFATAAGNIKKTAAERIEKRDAKIAQLQAAAGSSDTQLSSLSSSREALAAAVAQYKKRVAALSARLVALGEEDPQKAWVEPPLDPADVDMEEAACTKSLPHHCMVAGPSALRRKKSLDAEAVDSEGKANKANGTHDGEKSENGEKENGKSMKTEETRAVTFRNGDQLVLVQEVASFKTSGTAIWIPHPGKKVCCDQCGRWVPTMSGFLLSDPSRSQFMQERFLCGECGEKVLQEQGEAAAAASAAAKKLGSETPSSVSPKVSEGVDADETTTALPTLAAE